MTTPATPASTTSTSVTGFRHYDLKSIHVPHWLQTVGHHPRVVTGFVVAVAVVYGIWYERHKRRAEQINRVVATMGSVLGCPDGMTLRHGWGNKPVRWEHGTIQVVKAKYPKKTVAPPKVRAQMEEALKELLEAPVDLRWDLLKGHLTMSRVKPVAETDAKTMGQLRQVFAVLDGAAVTADEYDVGQVAAFTVTYAPTSADADEAWRAKMDGVVCTKTDREWVTRWQPSEHRVTYKARPELPGFLAHPTTLATDADRPYLVPVGVSADGPVTWNLDDQTSPHALAVGTTGAGKSSLLAGLIVGAARLGAEIRIIDGKGDSLSGLKEFPGVTDFEARNHQRMVQMLTEIDDLRQARSDAVDDESTRRDDLRHLIIVVDEAGQLIRRSRTKEDKAEILRCITSLSAAGRSARVHLVLGLHQARADLMGGTEVRGLFAVRVALGRMDRHSRQMLGLHSDVPATPPGRALVATPDGRERQTQVYWTPSDPAHSLNQRDADLMAALVRPVRQVATVQTITSLPAVLSSTPPFDTPADERSDTPSPPVSDGIPAPLSDETVGVINRLADEVPPLSIRQIALRAGVSRSTAHKYVTMHRVGATDPGRPILRIVGNNEV